MSTATLTKSDVLKVIRDHQDKIKACGVKRVGLFGSFARQEQNLESDVDLLVEFEQDRKNFDNFMRLSFLLEDSLGRRVEVVTSEALSPYIGPRILKEVEYVSFSS